MHSQRSILTFFGKPNKFTTIDSSKNIDIIDKKPISLKNIDSLEKNITTIGNEWWKPKNNIEKSQDTIECFTDGACINNGKKYAKASYAIVWPLFPNNDIGASLDGNIQTNNRAELTAIIEAFRVVEIIDPSNSKTLKIYTDSELCINSLTKWISGWKRNGWKTKNKEDVSNRDLLETIDKLMIKRKHIFEHVRAHTGKQDYKSINNDKVDRLAKQFLN